MTCPQRPTRSSPEALVGWVLALLLLAGSASPAFAGPDVTTLDLDGAIDRALEFNYGLRRERHRLAASQSSLLGAENLFDFKLTTTFASDLALQRNIRLAPVGGGPVVIGPDVVDDVEVLTLTLSKEMRWGGRFDVTGAATRSRMPFSDAGGDDLTHRSAYAVAYTQPLWRGRGRRVATSSLVRSGLSYLGEARSLAEREMGLIVSVTRTFYQVARSRRFIEINQAAVDRAAERLRTAELRLEEGLITPIDVARSKRELRVRQNSVITSQESWENARDQLLLLLGLALETPFELKPDVEFAPVSLDLEDAIAEALASRVDIKNQRDTVELAELSEHVARLDTKPQVDLTLSAAFAGETGGEAATFFDVRNDDTWQANLVVSHTFGERTDDEALLRAKIDVQNARLSLTDLERQVVTETKGAVRQVLSLQRQIDVLETNVELARESLRLASLQFDEGLISTVDLLDDQNQLVQAETDYVNALYDHRVAKTNLDLVLGRYWTSGQARTSEHLRAQPAPPVDVAPRRPARRPVGPRQGAVAASPAAATGGETNQ